MASWRCLRVPARDRDHSGRSVRGGAPITDPAQCAARRQSISPPPVATDFATWSLALVVGSVGGLYGLGGGSILAPVLIVLGYCVYEVAPATLAATFLTSIAGIATYQILQAIQGGSIAPQWILGGFLRAGGFDGS